MKNVFVRKSDIVLLLTGLAAILYFAYSFTKVYPDGALKEMIPQSTAEKLIEEFLDDPRFAKPVGLDSLTRLLQIDYDPSLARYLQETAGLEMALDKMRTSVPVFTWQCRWLEIGSADITFGRSSDKEKSKTETKRGLEVVVDNQGRLVSYVVKPAVDGKSGNAVEQEPRTLGRDPMAGDSARLHALTLIAELARTDTSLFTQTRYQAVTRDNASSYEFVFTRNVTSHGLHQTASVEVTNGLVTKYAMQFEYPATYIRMDDRWYDQAQDLAEIIFLIAAIVLTTIYFFVRFRRGAFNFKLGMFYGIVVAIGFSIMVGMSIGRVSWLGTLVVTVFAGGFYFLVTAIVIAVCASLARDVWPEKYQTFEAITRGRFFNQNSGISFSRGLLWSFILLGGGTVVLQIVPDSAAIFNEQSFDKYEMLGSVFVITGGIWTSLLAMHAYYLLPLTLLKRRFPRPALLYVSSMIISMVVPYVFDGTSGLSTRLILGAAFGLVYAHLVIRYDFMTLIVAAMMSYIISESAFLFFVGSVTDLTILVLFFGMVLILAMVALLSRQSGSDVLEYVPEYIKEMETKQRMQREFEIARQIQGNLLCRTTPSLPVFDIASFCDPAYEVGGDYYDFVHFPGQRMGVVIGDVSGKGVSAAFYMTLAKGIVQTQALMTPHSTKETLSRVNDVFYQQIDRGKFISMIYAIFDYERGRVILSRAGHNPVLIKKSTDAAPESLSTRGMAIGLATGSLFADELEETELPFRPGDLFVFYTDGFPEARNAHDEEFGEEKLCEVIQRNNHLDASDIVKSVRQAVGAFAGETPQHDDMTMIVVKIR